MSNPEKNYLNALKAEAQAILAEYAKPSNKNYSDTPVLQVKPGMTIVGLGKVKTVQHNACATNGTHLNTTKCYDRIATVTVVTHNED